MTGAGYRPLLVAGVAGGVGTSTWVRCLQLVTNLPVQDLGVYGGGVLDVLVCSNTAAATSRLGSALAACPRPPVLVVMHTAAGVVVASRSYLRRVGPHITARFDIGHQRRWLEMDSAPGSRLPAKVKDIDEALRRFPEALRVMYSPPRPVSPMPTRAAPGAGLEHLPWRSPGGPQRPTGRGR